MEGDGDDGKVETESGFLSFLAVAMWLGGFHINFFVAMLCLLYFPNPWAVTLLAAFIVLIFLPVQYGSPLGSAVAGLAGIQSSIHLRRMDSVDSTQSLGLTSLVFAVQPHSVLPLAFLVYTPQSGFLPICNLRALASTGIFCIPIVRHIWSWLGTLPVTRKNFTELLQSGTSCVFSPGGVQECNHMKKDREVVFLKNRYGFVRVAMETGSPLVPTFCFGQNNSFKWWKPTGEWFNQLSRVIGFTPLVYWGRFGGPMPFQHPLYYVVGKPIEVTKSASPTHEEVVAVLGQFIEATKDLFENHKGPAGFKSTPLYVY